MGILRYGDPDNNPNDRRLMKGALYELDMIVTSGREVAMRKQQLETNGKNVEIISRFATPEEAHEHLSTDTHKDGRFTKVWEIWIAIRRIRFRRKKMSRSKVVRKKSKNDLADAALDLTKAAVIGTVGLGLMAGMGFRKKSRKSAVKVKSNADIGDMRKKRAERIRKVREEKRERDAIYEENDYATAQNNLAARRDIRDRFGGYDIDVGGMYQRKRKTKKSNVKRCRCNNE